MRTTLDIDPDILGVAKSIANSRGISTGKALSDLARQSLASKNPPKYRNGIRLLEARPGAPILTMEMVNHLMDEE
jgi:hypothetical protein